MYRLALRISVVELRPKEFPRSWRLLNMETIVGSRDREENGTGNSHHLLFIPMIMQAHFAPAIRLAEKLSARGLKIIIVTISKHAESLNKIYTPEGLLKLGLSVEVVEDPKIDPKLPGAWSPLNVAKCMEESCRPLQQRLLGKKKAGSPYPTCMLADKFFTWSKVYIRALRRLGMTAIFRISSIV